MPFFSGISRVGTNTPFYCSYMLTLVLPVCLAQRVNICMSPGTGSFFCQHSKQTTHTHTKRIRKGGDGEKSRPVQLIAS